MFPLRLVKLPIQLVSETLLSVSEAVSSQLTYSNVQHGRTWVLDMLDMLDIHDIHDILDILDIATTQPTTQNNLKQLLLGWFYYQ